MNLLCITVQVCRECVVWTDILTVVGRAQVLDKCKQRGQLLAGCEPQFLSALLMKLRVVFYMPSEEVPECVLDPYCKSGTTCRVIIYNHYNWHTSSRSHFITNFTILPSPVSAEVSRCLHML